MLKKINLKASALQLLFILLSVSETVAQNVLATSGAEYSQPSLRVAYTLGEPITQSYGIAGLSVSQGFHQPDILRSARITGPDTVCQSASTVYTVSGVSGATAFTWSASPSTGVTFSGTSQTSKTVKITGSGNFTISALPNNGQPAVTKTIFVRVLPTLGTVSGPKPVCQGGTGNYTVTGMLNATSYSWSAPTGASVLSSSGPSATYQFGTGASYTISVRGSNNGCLATAARTLAVNTTLPPSGGSISGNATVCQGAVGTYSVTGMANTTTATVYTWTASNGATMTGTGTSRTITFPNSGSSTITVQTANGGCAGATLTLNVTVNAAPVGTYAISGGATTACEGVTVNYTTTNTSGVTYTWSLNPSSGGTILSGQGTSAASIRYNGTYTTASTPVTVSMVPSIGSCAKAASTKAVTVNKIPTAGSLSTAPDTACTAQTVVCTASATNATTYTWSISGAANAGSGSTSSRTISMGTKNISVKVTPKNGTCSGTQLSKTVVYKASGCAKEGETLQAAKETGIQFELYPNPAADYVKLKLSGMEADERFSLKWYDVSGRLLRTDEEVYSGSGTEVQLYRGGMAAGVYLLRLENVSMVQTGRLTLE